MNWTHVKGALIMKKTYISIEWGDTRTRFERAEAIKKALELVTRKAQKPNPQEEAARKAA
jgi:hypothetical protein